VHRGNLHHYCVIHINISQIIVGKVRRKGDTNHVVVRKASNSSSAKEDRRRKGRRESHRTYTKRSASSMLNHRNKIRLQHSKWIGPCTTCYSLHYIFFPGCSKAT